MQLLDICVDNTKSSRYIEFSIICNHFLLDIVIDWSSQPKIPGEFTNRFIPW